MGRTTRILIVEDNELMRDGLRAVLERVDGFSVVGDAEDGVSAVELAQSLRPDVIIMDVGLPLMNGIEATREIKKLLPDTNIVMLTSHDRKEELFAALSAGAAGYCLKDCASDRIKIAVSSVSDGAAWIDPRIAGLVLRAFDAPVPITDEPAAPGLQSDLLSQREREVLRLMVDGASNKVISEKLIISLSTVRTHVEHILEKLAVKGRTAAAVKAMKEGLI